MGSVNMLSPSGVNDNYFVTVGSLESGVTVGQRFITGAKQREKDDDSLDKLNGFTHKYIDASNTIYSGPRVDRFVISSHDNSSYGVNNLILMKNHSNGGILGVNNFSEGGDAVIPQTSFNVRTNHDATARITAENAGQVSSALQLLTNLNCLVVLKLNITVELVVLRSLTWCFWHDKRCKDYQRWSFWYIV